MLSMPKIAELMFMFAVVFLIFGPSKLPSLGKAMGETIRNFRKGIRELNDDGRGDDLLTGDQEQGKP